MEHNTAVQPRAVRVTLQVTAGPHQGRTYTYEGQDSVVVGRSRSTHFHLPGDDPYLSRRHFQIEVGSSGCCLRNLNSHNGTFVNGQRVETVELRDGDEVQAGNTVLRVTIERPGGPDPDELADAQEQAWRQGQRILVEEYLRRYPGLTGRPERVLELIHGEYELRRLQGERPDVAEYEQRFPALRGAIRLLLTPN